MFAKILLFLETEAQNYHFVYKLCIFYLKQDQFIIKKRFVLKMTTFVPTNQKIGEFDTKQAYHRIVKC